MALSGLRQRLRGADHSQLCQEVRTCQTVGASSDYELVLEIVAAVADGATQRSVACRYGVSPATVNTLWRRWHEASADERVDGRCLEARRPVPKSCPWALSDAEQQRILTARAKTNWGPMRLAALVGRHRATVWKGAQAPRGFAPTPRRAPDVPSL
jgi:transposase